MDTLELTLDDDIPASVRDHPFVRRIWQLAALAALAHDDLASLDQDAATRSYAPAPFRTLSSGPAEQTAYARLVGTLTDKLVLMLDWQRNNVRFRRRAEPTATALRRLRGEAALPAPG